MTKNEMMNRIIRKDGGDDGSWWTDDTVLTR